MTQDNVTISQRVAETTTLYDIALVKSYSYTQEYNPTNGRVSDRQGHHLLKEGYVDGFMAGFAYKFTGRTE